MNVLRAENDPKPRKVEVKRFVDEKMSWQERSAMMAQLQAQQQAALPYFGQRQALDWRTMGQGVFSPFGLGGAGARQQAPPITSLEGLFGRIT